MADDKFTVSKGIHFAAAATRAVLGLDTLHTKDPKEKFTLQTMEDTWHSDVLHAKMLPAEPEAAEASWQEKYREVIRNREAAVAQSLEELARECETAIRKKKQDLQRAIDLLHTEHKEYEQKLAENTRKLESLKNYQLSKKQETTNMVMNYKSRIWSARASSADIQF